jgi:RNA polymerase sigma-70 factor (ECF subfamily)
MTSQLVSRDYAVTDSDAALLERLRLGDSTAFERLFLRHYAQVYRVLYHLVGSREEAEDLAQETFMALYHQPPATEKGASLVAWLCRVALNRGYNALRGQRRAQERLARLAEPPAQIDPQDELARAEDRALVRAAIAELPERQGQMLLLRYAGLSYGEIANTLDLAPASVGTLLARAERAFETAYARLHPAEPIAAGIARESKGNQ